MTQPRQSDTTAVPTDHLSECEKCGHLQAEPNWCHTCGHRVKVPAWARELLADLETQRDGAERALELEAERDRYRDERDEARHAAGRLAFWIEDNVPGASVDASRGLVIT
jgi:hypothetical protein